MTDRSRPLFADDSMVIICLSGPVAYAVYYVLCSDALYVFGGEFSTYYQFHHYKDFWKFDLKSNLWSKILVECPAQVPSPRSGHRMVNHCPYICTFKALRESLSNSQAVRSDDCVNICMRLPYMVLPSISAGLEGPS